ncbi:hypothetical protein [Streptomyces sp. NPDC088736]
MFLVFSVFSELPVWAVSSVFARSLVLDRWAGPLLPAHRPGGNDRPACR